MTKLAKTLAGQSRTYKFQANYDDPGRFTFDHENLIQFVL
jgi:hypothetical protein